jgi:uncharacterized protein (UPF0276 family)
MAAPVPSLGPGAVYLPALDEIFRRHPDLIRVAEVEPQTMWIRSTAPGAFPRGSATTIARLASLPQAKLLHGVGAPLAGRWCDQHRHIPEFLHWMERLATPWTSEHLSLLDVNVRGEGLPLGFLMPPCQSEEGAALAAANIRRRRDAIGGPIAFETGVSYFAPRKSEMPDGAFLASIAEQADCGILLDLHNLWANERNCRGSIASVIDALPLDRVWEVHLAGGEAHGRWWLDAHGGAIDPDLVAIAAEIMPHLPNVGAILFEIAPDRAERFGEVALLEQIETLHRLWERRPPEPRPVDRHPAPVWLRSTPGISVREWEGVIAQAMLPAAAGTAASHATDEAASFAADSGFDLYRALVDRFRRGVMTSLLSHAMRLLVAALDGEALDRLFADYAACVPPSLYASDEALAFAAWLAERDLDIAELPAVLAFEAAVLRSIVDETELVVTETDLAALAFARA